MESQTGETLGTLTAGLEKLEARLEAAASLFERTLALLEERHSTMTGEVQKIVAAVEHQQPSGRESEVERKLESAEQRIAELKAQIERAAAEAKPVRRTVPASTAQFLTKQGISTLDSVEAGALDAALTGLSLEQRIAVKAQLLRAGVLNGSV
jgi:exonuclease VII small subunit